MATMHSGSFTVNKWETEKAFAAIRNRASFEMHCPSSNLELTVLNVDKQAFNGDTPTQIGASGCGQSAVYVRIRSEDWVLNATAK